MSTVDMSLDDLIKKDGRAPGGRRPAAGGKAPGGRSGGVVRGGRPARSAPYARSKGSSASADSHLANADVRDVAASDNPVLKVKGDSKPNSVAGAICNIMRESPSGQPPSVVATGPAAINQAMKAIAIARKYMLDEDSPTDMIVFPRFEEDIRQSSRVCFELKKSRKIKTTPSEDDLACKDKTDPYKLAGAMAGRVREGEQVACTTKGPVPVLIAVKAIALAQTYVEEEEMELKFAVSIVDLENPEIRSSEVTSTYLHFALIAK